MNVVTGYRLAGRGFVQLLAYAIALGQLILVPVAVPSLAQSGDPSATLPSRTPAIGPELIVSLTPDAQTAHVTNSQNGPVMFNGSVRMNHLVPGLRYTITLGASCDWPSIVSPSTVVVNDDTAMDFTVNVVVPPATPRDATSTLIVSASAKAPGIPAYTAQDQATVTVGPYYNVHLAVPVNTVEMRRGSTTHVLCNLSNECNCPMGFQFQLLDPPDGITLGPVRIVTLAQGDIIDVDLAYEVTGNAPTGKHELVVQIQFSGDAPGASPETQSMTVDVVPGVGRSATSLVAIVTTVVVAIAVVVLYKRRSSRRQRREATPPG